MASPSSVPPSSSQIPSHLVPSTSRKRSRSPSGEEDSSKIKTPKTSLGLGNGSSSISSYQQDSAVDFSFRSAASHSNLPASSSKPEKQSLYELFNPMCRKRVQDGNSQRFYTLMKKIASVSTGVELSIPKPKYPRLIVRVNNLSRYEFSFIFSFFSHPTVLKYFFLSTFDKANQQFSFTIHKSYMFTPHTAAMNVLKKLFNNNLDLFANKNEDEITPLLENNLLDFEKELLALKPLRTSFVSGRFKNPFKHHSDDSSYLNKESPFSSSSSSSSSSSDSLSVLPSASPSSDLDSLPPLVHSSRSLLDSPSSQTTLSYESPPKDLHPSLQEKPKSLSSSDAQDPILNARNHLMQALGAQVKAAPLLFKLGLIDLESLDEKSPTFPNDLKLSLLAGLGRASIKNGDKINGVKELLDAVSFAEKTSLNIEEPLGSETLHLLANTFLEGNNCDEAIKYAKQSLNILKNSQTPKSKELRKKVLNILSEAHKKNKQDKDLLKLLVERLEELQINEHSVDEMILCHTLSKQALERCKS